MIKNIRFIVFLFFGLLLSMPIAAQIVYQCDFENEEERALWLLNDGPRADKCPNRWYIGEAGNTTRDGANGLFISYDGEQANYSGSTNMYTVAARELQLEQGDYTLYFDWLAKGRAASGEGIWVCWVPVGVDTYSAASLRPNWVDDYRIDSVFNSSSIWRQAKVQFTSDGTPHKLVFVWTNAKNNQTVPPAGCVDDIFITPKEDECLPPTNFTRTMNGTTMRVSWQGDADWYDVRVYDYEKGVWQYFDNVTLKRIDIDGLSEGMAQIYVRSHCGADGISEYVLYTPFYFLPGKCVNYLAIDDKTQCTTFIGTATQPRGIVALVDSGYESISSRHTLHYVPGETDPRTDNQLLTKPEGALASVRLGNWNFGAEGECIEYTYNVPDGDVAILKLRYAIVLNQPVPSHDQETQSSFELHIFYSDPARPNSKKPLPGGCGDAIFHVGYGDQTGWHAIGNGEVMWKEWTEVSVNLRDYVGKRITVQLSTADCTAGGHYSYAYYTLDCESGELSGLNCGADDPTTSFTAPAGFDYEWYLPSAPDNILSREQIFTISPMDTLTYNVDVISKSNDKCYYTLDACGIPRYPVAKADYKWNHGEHCENIVTFYNQSYIYYKNLERWNQDRRTDTVYTANERVQETVWDFGDGEIVVSNADSISHVYPATGGTFAPIITASISDGACSVSQTIATLDLPNVSSDDKEVHLGKGSMFGGKVYWEPFEFDVVDTTEYGCEVLTHVTIHETEFQVDTSFCEGGAFRLGDQLISETGVYKATLKSVQWPNIDSIVTVTLHVAPALKVEHLPDTIKVCADEAHWTLSVKATQGDLDTVAVLMPAEAIAQGFESRYVFSGNNEIHLDVPMPESVRPDCYPVELDLGSTRCPGPDTHIILQVNYSSSILMQRVGFISLLNEEYNGGYTFSSFQWYRNGELVEGADQSYLIVNPNDIGVEYYVVPVRTDGVVVPVCPILYGITPVETVHEESPSLVYPTTVSSGQTLSIRSDSEWILMDMWGRTIVPYSRSESVQAPSQPGVYMFVFPSAHRLARVIVL